MSHKFHLFSRNFYGHTETMLSIACKYSHAHASNSIPFRDLCDHHGVTKISRHGNDQWLRKSLQQVVKHCNGNAIQSVEAHFIPECHAAYKISEKVVNIHSSALLYRQLLLVSLQNIEDGKAAGS